MDDLHGPSPSQFSFDDYDFSMAYDDFKNIREYVKSKVVMLQGNSFDQDRPEFFRDPRDLDPPRKDISNLLPQEPPTDGLETRDLNDVFQVKEIKMLGSFKNSIINEVLEFMKDLSVKKVNGHRIGTIVVIGDINEMLSHSTGEIPNPLNGHPRKARNIFKGSFKNSLAQFSQFDGFTGMDWDGCVSFCGRLIEVPRNLGEVPEDIMWHGARHKAGWTITKLVPGCVSLVLSQDGEIQVIMDGKILKKIITIDMVGPVFKTNQTTKLDDYLNQSFPGDDDDDPGMSNNDKEDVFK